MEKYVIKIKNFVLMWELSKLRIYKMTKNVTHKSVVFNKNKAIKNVFSNNSHVDI